MEARAPLLLLLDDDMEASPDLLAAHLRGHSAHPGDVLLGHFSIAGRDPPDELFATSARIWWGDRFSDQARTGHRFTFKDVHTGNLAVPRDLFESVGGFDEAFRDRAGEDFELGVRLLRAGARLRFLPGATCLHKDANTVQRSLERAFAEGRGHVLIAGKHPETFAELPLASAMESSPPVAIGRRLEATTPARMRLWERFLLGIAGLLKWRRLFRRVYGALRARVYWSGVLAELGSVSRLRRFVQEVPLRRFQFTEGELDLRADLDRLAEVLLTDRMDAARIRHGELVVGRVPPVAAAEPLRPEHLREWLRMDHALWILTARDRAGDGDRSRSRSGS
jgi:GT2 family glycosyltransferase